MVPDIKTHSCIGKIVRSIALKLYNWALLNYSRATDWCCLGKGNWDEYSSAVLTLASADEGPTMNIPDVMFKVIELNLAWDLHSYWKKFFLNADFFKNICWVYFSVINIYSIQVSSVVFSWKFHISDTYMCCESPFTTGGKLPWLLWVGFFRSCRQAFSIFWQFYLHVSLRVNYCMKAWLSKFPKLTFSHLRVFYFIASNSGSFILW